MTDTPASHEEPAPLAAPLGLSSEQGWSGKAARACLVVVAGFAVVSGLLLFGMAGPPDVLADAMKMGEGATVTTAALRVTSLGYRYYTDIGIELKAIGLSLSLGVLCVVAGLIILLRGTPSPGAAPTEGAAPDGVLEPPPGTRLLSKVGLVDIAQGLLVLLVLWSLMSRAWSHAPELTTRATGLLAIQVAWALLLSRAILLVDRPRRAVLMIVGVLLGGGLAALLMVFRLRALEFWPHGSFLPVGSSQDFGGCMLPLLVLAPLWAWALWPEVRRGSAGLGTVRWASAVAGLGTLVLTFGLAAWGLAESGSRPAWIGALAGVVAFIVWRLTGRLRWLALTVGVLLVVLAVSLSAGFAMTSGSLESADIRQCAYGWRYALRALHDSQALGLGQAGFALSCDPWIIQDLPFEPTALAERWRGHAQSEWIETLSDLGLLGFQLSLGAVVVTVIAGWRCLVRTTDPRIRWLLSGLLAALVGLSIEECFASGLRRSVLPTTWYTTLGLIWALILSTDRRRVASNDRAPLVRFAVGPVLVVLGVGVCAGSWLQLLGEHEFALARQRLHSPRPERVAEAVDMTRRAARRTLSPRSQVQARLVSARAHYVLGVRHLNEVFSRAGAAVNEDMAITATMPTTTAATTAPTTATRPVTRLWPDPTFRATWEDADEHLQHALRRVADVQRLKPEAVGRATLEAEACRALAKLWHLRAALTGIPGEAIFAQAVETAQRYQLRVQTTLLAAFARQPFDDSVTVALLRSKHDLTVAQVADLLRRPLRSPYLTEEYRSVLIQAAQTEEFRKALSSFLERARADVMSGSDEAWQDPFSPETMRMIAIIYEMQGKFEQAAAAMNQALRLYEMAHYRLSAEQALAMADLAWYQFLLDRGQARKAALGVAERARQVSERPATHPVLRPVYRRMMPMWLAAGNEQAAASLIPYTVQQDEQVNPNVVLAWGYELLGRTFHKFKPSERPEAWGYWIQRAAELDPRSPDVRVLQALKDGERGDSAQAAHELRLAWELSRDLRNREEILRALIYLRRRMPQSLPLRTLHEDLARQLRAATQPSRAGAPVARPPS